MMNDQHSILLVSPLEEDHRTFDRIFGQRRWTLRHARGLAEALAEIERTPVSVIVSETRLPDGDWRDLLERVREIPRAPAVIVTSEQADAALWATVLNLGAYDFLPKPFEPAEVMRIVGLAWLFWNDQAGWRSPTKVLSEPGNLPLSYAA